MKRLLNVKSDFFAKLLSLALPMAAQSVFQALVGFADVIMVSQLGENSLAAVSLSNQVFAILLLVFFGMGSGSGIFFSRYWGSNDSPKIRRVFGFSAAFNFIIAIVGTAFICYYSYPILMALSNSETLTVIGRPYLLITAISFPMIATSVIISSFWRSIEKSSYPMWISFGALILAVVLNYIFIFGKLGVPALGVAGAAWATLITRFIECLAFIILFVSAKNPIKKGTKDYFFFIFGKDRGELMTSFVKVIFPFMIADVVWVLAITAYKAVYARMGESVVAAFSAVDSVYQIFMVLFYALGGASCVMLGKSIGEHRLEYTQQLAESFVRLNFVIAIPLSIIFIGLAPFMASFFHFEGETAIYARQATILCGLFLSVRSLEFILTVGILRSGGDSRFNFIAQTTTLWLFGVPAAFIGVYIFNLDPLIIYLIVLSEELLRDLVFYLRYRSKKWIHIL